mgnify:CR=1 FL=1
MADSEPENEGKLELPVPKDGPGAEIVARSRRDIETMTDAELLGGDYSAWLGRQKARAQATAARGQDARLRAEKAMAAAEAQLARLEARRGE